MERQFLHSENAMTRKLSCAAYCVATMVATLAWVASAGIAHPSPARWIGGLFPALLVWWIVAGIALRLVRLAERLGRRSADQARQPNPS